MKPPSPPPQQTAVTTARMEQSTWSKKTSGGAPVGGNQKVAVGEEAGGEVVEGRDDGFDGDWETSKLVIGCGDAERGACKVRSPVDGDAGVMPRRVSYPICCFVLSRSGHPSVHGGEPRAAERVGQYHPWRPREGFPSASHID
uniref:DUF834 domain-containing protein n=1 Tax=Oryza meridionalis TaxID=40149 RepID=A0A0E0CYS8_9ORYZ